MTSDDALTDAERIELGLNPLQDERLHDLHDLWRVLERLGHKPSEHIPTTHWDNVNWTCPQDDCDGSLAPVDTRARNLPADPDNLDESVDHDDPELYLHLREAQSPNVPVVACYECKSVFKASFRRLCDPEEKRLPEPRIVETPGTLSGRPRIDGTRIGVEHVWAFHEQGDSAEDIAKKQYPVLSENHVRVAIEWAQEHPDRMTELHRENEEMRLRHDIFQSVVDAGVEECIDGLWSLMANTKATDISPIRPVASLFRNGFESADGVNIDINADEQRVTFEVSDEVVARLNDNITPESGEESDSTTGGESGTSDVNEQVESEWVEDTTPFDRVRTVMKTMYEAQPVDEIAEKALTTPTLTREQLRRLADVGFVEGTTGPDRRGMVYRRSPDSLALEQARQILSEVDSTTLKERIAEMQEDIRVYQEQFEAVRPEEVAETNDELNREALREWRTTQRNLRFAKVALALSEESEDVYPEQNDSRDDYERLFDGDSFSENSG